MNRLRDAFRRWREKRRREKYLTTYSVNLKCRSCGAWSSDQPSQAPMIYSIGHPMAVEYKCASCGDTSHWVCEAGIWFSAEEFLGSNWREVAE